MNTLTVTLTLPEDMADNPAEWSRIMDAIRGYMEWFVQTERDSREYTLRDASGDPVGTLTVRKDSK